MEACDALEHPAIATKLMETTTTIAYPEKIKRQVLIELHFHRENIQHERRNLEAQRHSLQMLLNSSGERDQELSPTTSTAARWRSAKTGPPANRGAASPLKTERDEWVWVPHLRAQLLLASPHRQLRHTIYVKGLQNNDGKIKISPQPPSLCFRWGEPLQCSTISMFIFFWKQWNDWMYRSTKQSWASWNSIYLSVRKSCEDIICKAIVKNSEQNSSKKRWRYNQLPQRKWK